MCGIIGYTGHRPAVPVLVEGLRRLEYRGYDSSGIAVVQQGALHIRKEAGKLEALERELASSANVLHATAGIAHTRWATHGEPTRANAHPHCAGQHDTQHLAIVHNGIIENYRELKAELEAKGYAFASQTDTEVLAHLIDYHVALQDASGVDGVEAGIRAALARAEGAYAIVVVDTAHPGILWGARKQSPMVLGTGVGENFLASDIPAFLPYSRDVVFLDDGELVRMDASGWRVTSLETGEVVDKQVQTITWDVQAAQKGGYKHFMLKEIFEQPRVITDCLTGRMDAGTGTVRLPELADVPAPAAGSTLHIVACGTSYHAGLWGRYLLEQWAGVRVNVEIASEFRYRQPLLSAGDYVLAISQSGETADTLAGMRIAREAGLTVLGLCNVVGSSVARESDHVIYTQAGPEISVASTKAMCSQLTLLLALALHWAEEKQRKGAELRRAVVAGLATLPATLEATLPAMRSHAAELARRYADATSFMYLGRGLAYPLALEGALKLKEISYIHAEGYAAGEMKHGPIALIDPKFPSFAIALDDELYPKVVSNLIEVQARGGRVIALTQGQSDLDVDHPWDLPQVAQPLGSFLALSALQLFSYEMADYLGKDVDQPRNLAKSVTVE